MTPWNLPLPDEGRSPRTTAVEMGVKISPRPVSAFSRITTMTHKLRPTYYVKRDTRLPMIFTQRLDLVEASPDHVRAAIHDPAQLGVLLHAQIARGWPPELLDVKALEWTLRWLENPTNDHSFGLYWMVLRESASLRTLVGVAGFKGMPSEDGTVELGYGVVAEYQRRGYATETVRAFLAHAFASPKVTRVIAETLPGLAASIGVLEKCGFTFIGDGSEAGVIRYEIKRAAG
jgi:RimJ/RimL family protein N-acetyltransferase